MEKETHLSNCILNGSCWLQRAYFTHLQNVWNVLNFILLICYFFLTKPWKWVLRTLDQLSVGPFWMLTSFIHSGVNSQGMLLESFYCNKSSGESLRTNWHWIAGTFASWATISRRDVTLLDARLLLNIMQLWHHLQQSRPHKLWQAAINRLRVTTVVQDSLDARCETANSAYSLFVYIPRKDDGNGFSRQVMHKVRSSMRKMRNLLPKIQSPTAGVTNRVTKTSIYGYINSVEGTAS